jgi:hypothetical protein
MKLKGIQYLAAAFVALSLSACKEEKLPEGHHHGDGHDHSGHYEGDGHNHTAEELEAMKKEDKKN